MCYPALIEQFMFTILLNLEQHGGHSHLLFRFIIPAGRNWKTHLEQAWNRIMIDGPIDSQALALRIRGNNGDHYSTSSQG